MAIVSMGLVKTLLHLDSDEETIDLLNEDLPSFSIIAQNLTEEPMDLCAVMSNYGFIGGLLMYSDYSLEELYEQD